MTFLVVQRHAIPAPITMVIINAQSFTHATYTTPIAMIRFMPRSIIKEVAYFTEIMCKFNVATATLSCYWLISITTYNTSYLFDCMPVNFVRFSLVVTSPARIITSAACRLNPTPSRIMLASSTGTFPRKTPWNRMQR